MVPAAESGQPQRRAGSGSAPQLGQAPLSVKRAVCVQGVAAQQHLRSSIWIGFAPRQAVGAPWMARRLTHRRCRPLPRPQAAC